MTLVRKSLTSVAPQAEILVAGRVTRTCIWGQDQEFISVIWNVHNHDLTSTQIRSITARMTRDLEWAQEDPFHRVVHVAGDFNLLPEGQHVLHFCQAGAVPPSGSEVTRAHQSTPRRLQAPRP